MERPNAEAPGCISRRDVLALLFAGATLSRARAETTVVRIAYIRSLSRHPVISLLDQPAPDAGLAGAKLAAEDNAITGQVAGQGFDLVDQPLRRNADPVDALHQLAGQGIRLILTDLPAADVLKLADAGRDAGAFIFNIAAEDDSLREQDCRPNVIHVAPTRSMLADALAQYLVWKKWTRWFLVVGSHDNDKLLAEAYRRSAKRFGAKIVEERVSPDTGGARETDSGVVQTQQQMPVLTQNAPSYDVLIAADENEVFAGYLPYRTWDARPVAGSAGLEPVTWDPSSESWGGTQLQNRFVRQFHRRMMPLDMQAWTAVRMIGEAATRSKSTDPAMLVKYMEKPEFGIGAYKGQLLTLRDWNLQLRQPILLSDGRTVVSISPQPGFLHQFTELDTLGIDRPETKCRMP